MLCMDMFGLCFAGRKYKRLTKEQKTERWDEYRVATTAIAQQLACLILNTDEQEVSGLNSCLRIDRLLYYLAYKICFKFDGDRHTNEKNCYLGLLLS